MNFNELTSAICDMEDIKETIKAYGMWEQLKDGDGTEITVGDCVDDVLEFLKELEKETK